MLEEKLITYGFKKNRDNQLSYQQNVIPKQIDLKITVVNQKLQTQLWNIDFDEEYVISSQATGSFVAEVKEKVDAILEDIHAKCYERPQVERLQALIEEKYGLKPKHPFKTYHEITTYNGYKDKIFAMFWPLEKGKITKKNDSKIINMLNVKADPDEVLRLQTKPGFYPAYHMNKKHWVTVLLDESQTDDVIFTLIKQSFELIKK